SLFLRSCSCPSSSPAPSSTFLFPLLPPPFLLSCPPAHPDLHSFPTRRSSDLRTCPVPAGPDPVRVRWPPRRRGRSRASGTGRGGDRKSTRLNSSHVSISYAVFCLKKKKKDRERKGCR